MRACVAFGCLLGVLAVTALPGLIDAQQTASIASSLDGGNTRGLLVVDNKLKPADQITNSDSAGISSVSLGSDLFVSDDRAQPKPTADTTAATKKPQQVNAAKKGKKTAGLGRKGGKNFRQLANGTFPDDYILPGCRPGLGVICADNDNLGLLKALPAEVDLDNTYPFFELTPKGGFTVQNKDTADLGFDTFTSANTVEGTGGGGLTLGTEQLNADNDVTTTLASTTVDASRRDRIIPDSIKTKVYYTDATGTYTWNTVHPIYTYAIGQNWGFPNGLQTVTDGITGRKK